MGRFPPFTRRSLLSRDEATGTRACKLNKASCHELSAAALLSRDEATGTRACKLNKELP